MLVSHLIEFLDEIAPFSSAQSFDNVGLLIGNLKDEIETVLIALDVNRYVLNQAKELNAQLILTHHPIIFNPVKSIKTNEFLFELICSKINVVAMHTNLDCAKRGVSFCLANALDLQKIEVLANSEGFGRIGMLKNSLGYEDFLALVSNRLRAYVIKATKFDRLVNKVAVVSGAGGFALKSAMANGADVFVTGECKHSDFMDAFNNNFGLVAAGHFETEVIFSEPLRTELAAKFGAVNFIVAKEVAPARHFCGDFNWL